MPDKLIISIGSRIKIRLDDQLIKLQVVSVEDVDPGKGKISYRSPVGEALLGKRVGKKFEIKLPNESKIFCEVIDVQ